MCSKSESGFWLHFEKYRRRRVQVFLRTRKQYPAASIQTCVHPWRLGKEFLNQTDVIESCSRERTNTKWRFYKLTNLTVFAASLKDVSMGCKNAVLTEPLLKTRTINCLTFDEITRQPYNDNLCLLRALALHLHGTQRLEEETSKISNLFINKMDGLSADQFQGVHMYCWRSANSQHSPVWYRYCGWEHCRRTWKTKCAGIRKNCATAKIQQPHMLREQHQCSLPIFSLPCLWHFLQQSIQFGATFNYMQWTIENCLSGERISNPKNSAKLDSSGIHYRSEQKLFKELAKFDFESTCVQEETFRDTITTTWIGKRVPITVSISSNLVEEPSFLCNSDPHHLVASFIGVLGNLAAQSKAKMKNLFLDIETAKKIKLGSILEKLT